MYRSTQFGCPDPQPQIAGRDTRSPSEVAPPSIVSTLLLHDLMTAKFCADTKNLRKNWKRLEYSASLKAAVQKA
jgi:hypothetical protein